jgi:DNA-binding SARP family transcriptional activator
MSKPFTAAPRPAGPTCPGRERARTQGAAAQAGGQAPAGRAAFGACVARGDRIGELLRLAAIIEGFYVEEGALEPLDHWIAALQARLPAPDAWPSPELEARIIGCGVGIRLRAPAHPMLDAWAARGAVLVRQLAPGAARTKLATFLAQHHLWRGDLARAGVIIDAMPGLDVSALLPGEALVWLDTVATWARYTAQHERARDAVDAALELARRHALPQREFALHARGASVALTALDLPRARRHAEAMRPVLDGTNLVDQTHYWHYQAGLALAEGDAARAAELARTALRNSAEVGGPTRWATHVLSLGQALLQAGDPGAALACFDDALAAASSIDAAQLVFTAHLMRAASLLRLQRDDDALPSLRDAWGLAARRDFRTTAAWWLPQVVAQAAQAALAHGIEREHVQRFVRLHALAGADPTLAEWPWALALRGFAGFEATIGDGVPLQRGPGKTARRPFDLLRLLLAHAPAPLPVTAAMAALWPEADACAQRKAFDVALLRLRRILADARLLRLEGGRLSLDPRWCWTDTGALHALMQRIGSAHGATLPQLQRWARSLLGLVRGPFLADDDAPWVLAARDRLRRRFVVTVAQLAAQLEPLEAALAALLYERALDVEPLAETLSRRLMRLHAARGDRAEALRAWRACRAALAASGGLEPAPETRALVLELGCAA